MDIRYFHDPETGEPHIYGHGVTEDEEKYILRHPGEDRPGRDDSRPGMRSAKLQLADTCA